MKNSNKYFWIVLGILILIPLVLLLSLRSVVSDYILPGENPAGRSMQNPGKMIQYEYNFDGFTKIEVAGGWHVEITEGDSFAVSAEYSEEAEKEILIQERGDRLYIGLKDPSEIKISKRTAGSKIIITMPELTDVSIKGFVNMTLSGFNLDAVTFSLSGAGQIKAADCIVQQLILDIDGAVNFDFNQSTIKNADIDIDGAANIDLHMDGGVLSGKLDGLSNLEYSGTVSSLQVKKDGIGNIEHK